MRPQNPLLADGRSDDCSRTLVQDDIKHVSFEVVLRDRNQQLINVYSKCETKRFTLKKLSLTKSVVTSRHRTVMWT